MIRTHRSALAALLTAPLLALCSPQTLEFDDQRYRSEELVAPTRPGFTAADQWTRGRNFMIATDSPEASQAGAEMLEAGGNAVDAAAAVTFAISVVRPQSTALGGGGFLLLHLAGSKQSLSYDFRERAPLLAAEDMYVEDDGELKQNPRVNKRASLFGPLAVGVPGTIKGIVEIHAAHGKLPLARVIEPALRLAREGFPVYPALRDSIIDAREDMDDAMQAVFLPDGKVPDTGDRLIQSDLARTLERIRDEGAAPLYSPDGEIGAALVADMHRRGGLIRPRDLIQYRVYSGAPLTGEYHGKRIAIMPPPSSGVFILQMLNMLEEQYPTAEDARKTYTEDRVEYAHRLIETMRYGYRDRARYGGDPRFFKQAPLERLLSREYARKLVAEIDTMRAGKSSELEHRLGEDHVETTHFSIVDAEGNAVASTQSVNYSFGARIMLPGWGLVLNDTMDDFSARPGEPNVYGLIGGTANAIAPGKTPLSSMSPMLVFNENDEIELVLGAPGGSMIITAILHSFLNAADLEMFPYVAVARGRIHHQYMPDKVLLEESALTRSERERLEAMGHELKIGPHRGKAFVVGRDAEGAWLGVSDPRGDGRPVGR